MPDRLTSTLEALDRLPVPLRWDDVERLAAESSTDHPTDRTLTPLDDPTRAPRRTGNRRAALVAAAIALVVAGTVVVLRSPGDDGTPVRSGPAASPSTTADPGPTPTTQPAAGTAWGSAVQVWTGSAYLVWGGQVGGDDRGRADGWLVGPDGEVRDVPVASLAPRDSAAGVWTGTELIVCCGRSMGSGPEYDTASAAAYDPATDAWRVLADPPAETAGYVVGSAWTGREVLVVVQIGDPATEAYGDEGVGLYAYDPEADRWEERATPPWGDRFGEVTWTGDRLVIWSQKAPGVDGGVSYDPTDDAWTWLPDLPAEHPTFAGSVASVDGELVVFGLDGRDETQTAGYRLPAGGDAWQAMAPAPLPPIDWYEGTQGSQTLVADPARGQVIVYPTHGYESGGGGGTEGGPPPLLAYHLATDTWRELGDLSGAPYHPPLLVGGDTLYRPDRADAEVLDLER